jgi:eukaryotic-like serine/threonine-protein kinase
MAERATVEQFLQALGRSGLLSAAVAREIVEDAPPQTRDSAKHLAEHFVLLGKLSHFQARKLLDGTWAGLVLGSYQIVMPIGRGGMGTVYLARDTQTPRLLALKILPPKKARQSERLIARFRREMELSQRVTHPNLTQTYDVGQSMGVYYIAMEYIAGTSLYRVVATGGPLPVRRAAKLFAQAAAGLDAAHAAGLIHRDLKPSNIMVTPRDQVKVLDLGLAMITDETKDDIEVIGGRGYVVGSMDYIAPEQTENSAAADARSDLYGLGCALYFALSGQPPFPGGNSKTKIKRHRRYTPIHLQELNPLVSAEFATVIHSLLAKRPDDRPQTAAELRRLLLPFADPEPPPYVAPMPTAPVVADLEKDQPEDTDWDWTPPAAPTDANRRWNWRLQMLTGRSPQWWGVAATLATAGVLLLIVLLVLLAR